MQKTIEFLESFLSDARLERLKEVLLSRIKNITIILDNLLDSHNTSAVIRTAEGLGLTDVYVVEQDYQFEINKAVTKYSHKWINIHRFKKCEKCLTQVKQKGYKIFVANVSRNAKPLNKIPITPGVKYAFVFGNEHSGISSESKKLSDGEFFIPMYGFTESFNVSVAAAITLSYVSYNYRKFLRKNTDLERRDIEKLYFEYLKKAVKNSDIILKSFNEREKQSNNTWNEGKIVK